MASPDASKSAPAKRERNLTYDNLLVLVRDQRDRALEAIPEHEAVEVNVVRRDEKTGEVVKKNGFPILDKQAVMKRDLEALKWDAKINELIEMGAQEPLPA